MKYPKLWNGNSAVGEALVRQLQTTGAPYIRSSTADGVQARAMNGLYEVMQSDEPPIFEYITLPADANNPSGWGEPPDALLLCGRAPAKARLNTYVQAGHCVLWEGKRNQVITANTGVSIRFFPLQYAHNKEYVTDDYDILSPESALYLYGQKISAPGPVVGAAVFSGRLICVVRNSSSQVELFSATGVAAWKQMFTKYLRWLAAQDVSPTWESLGHVDAPDGYRFTKLWSFRGDGSVGGTVVHSVTPPEHASVLKPADVTTMLVEVALSVDEGVLSILASEDALPEHSLMSVQKDSTGGDLLSNYDEVIKVWGVRSIVEVVSAVSTTTYEALPIVDTPDGTGSTDPVDFLYAELDSIHDEIDVSWANVVVREPGRLVAQLIVGGNLERAYTSELFSSNTTRKTIDSMRLPTTHTFSLTGKEALGVLYTGAVRNIVQATPTEESLEILVTLHNAGRNNASSSSAVDLSLFNISDLVESDHVQHLDVAGNAFGSFFNEQLNSEKVTGSISYRVVAGDVVLSEVTISADGSGFSRRNTFSSIAGANEVLTVDASVVQTVRSAMAFCEVSRLVARRCATLVSAYGSPLETNYMARRSFTCTEFVQVFGGELSVESEPSVATPVNAFNTVQIAGGTNTTRAYPVLMQLLTTICRDRGGRQHDVGVGVIPVVTCWVKPPPYNTGGYTALSEQVWGSPHPSGSSQPNTYPPDRPFQDVWAMEYYQVGNSSGQASRRSAVASLRTAEGAHLNFAGRKSPTQIVGVPIPPIFDGLPQDNFRLPQVRRLA